MKSNPFYVFLKKPLVAGLFTFIMLLFIMQYIAYQRYLIIESEQKKELVNRVDLIHEKLHALVMYSYASTKTLGYIVERNGIPEDFDQIASELLDRSEYFDVVQLVDGNGFITHVYPLEGNEVIGFNIITSTTSSSGVLATIESKDFFIAGPVNLKQGGVGMISRQPIFIDGKFSRFSAVITKLTAFFEDLEIDTSNDDQYLYQLSKVNQNTGKEEFFLDYDISSLKSFGVPIEMSFGEWKLYVVPLNRGLNKAIWYALFGFLLAAISGWVVWYFSGQSKRINQIVRNKLKEQETQLESIHKTTRKKIEKSELLYRSLATNAPVAIFNTDINGACTYVNEEWMKYSGMNISEAMGFGWVNALHPEDKERVLSEWQEAITTGNDFQSEFRFQDKNGKITWLSVKATKLLDSNNNELGYTGMATDITERIIFEKELLKYKNNLETIVNSRTEELNDSKEALLNLLEDLNSQSIELEKEKVKAQSADLMKSAFLATMSHELRTPMNSIIGFTSILLKEYAGPLNEEQKKQMNMVKNSGNHLLKLINDILDISKIEAGELVITQRKFDYIKSINETIQFLQPQASRKEITIKTKVIDEGLTIKSDQRRVEQILLNLISNAIKFSDKDTINVNVSIVDGMVLTEIIDKGIGISAKDLKKLFKPFIQVEGGLSRTHEGTGLGLAISKNLVEKLGGTISAKSTLGKGSTFSFTLPL